MERKKNKTKMKRKRRRKEQKGKKEKKDRKLIRKWLPLKEIRKRKRKEVKGKERREKVKEERQKKFFTPFFFGLLTLCFFSSLFFRKLSFLFRVPNN